MISARNFCLTAKPPILIALVLTIYAVARWLHLPTTACHAAVEVGQGGNAILPHMHATIGGTIARHAVLHRQGFGLAVVVAVVVVVVVAAVVVVVVVLVVVVLVVVVVVVVVSTPAQTRPSSGTQFATRRLHPCHGDRHANRAGATTSTE